MSFVLMQPGNDVLSDSATKKLLNEGVCDFDVTTDGPRLRPSHQVCVSVPTVRATITVSSTK